MINRVKIISLITFLFAANQVVAQINVAKVRSYSQSIYSSFLRDTNATIKSSHLSFKPIHDSKTNTEVIFEDKGSYYYWITQKLFKEHFLIFSGEDFWCAVDPLVDLEIGQDFSLPDQSYRFWNTRGVRVQAKFFDNFGFETSIYETQASLIDFQSNYVDSHGEFIVLSNTYNQVNAIIPGYSRTKSFGEDGYDFAFAQGYFSYQPTDWLNIEAGNGNHFIGSGHRSLLLSDFVVNYPYIKPEFLLFDQKLQYNLIYASQQNLYRLPFHLTPEANYEKKMGVSHYLEYSVNKNFQVGLFESNIWVTTDSLGTKPFNYLALNPLIGNSALNGGNTPSRYNGFLGLNLTYNLKNNIFYSQVILDNKTISGFQFGLRTFDFLVQKLNIQLEYNSANSKAYLSQNKRANYNHSNLSLAHPLGNNFQEIVGIIDYQYKRIFVNYSANYSLRVPSDSTLEHSTLLYNQQFETNESAVNVWFNKLEVGYRFNKKNNFQIHLGFINRISTRQNDQFKANFAYFGIKTDLHQKILDW